MMQLVRTILLFCLVAAACGQEWSAGGVDVTPALNPLDVRDFPLVPEPKLNLRDIGHGLCKVYEFSVNNSVTADQVATFILNETPVRYRSALYDEFIKGGTQFVSRLANVGCHVHKIRNWFLSHMHRSNNADTMDTLSKPFAGLRDSADVAIMHQAMEYIHLHRSSAQDLHLIPETMCQVHELSSESEVSITRIVATAQNMPAEISHAFVERVLKLGSRGSRKIATMSAVGCKVLPAVVDLDVKSMAYEVTDVVPASTTAVAEHKSVIGTAGIGICAVREIVNRANITKEQVAEFILKKTPQRFRSKLYEEFVKGGTTFVARLANVGCNMVQVKSVITKMWPFGRFFSIMATLSKPFAGLTQSDEFKLLHEAIEYIEKHRGKQGLMAIPDTMCYIRKVSHDRRITKESVIREVEKRMPEELRRSIIDKIFRYGVNSIARVADVACKTLPVHVEIDVKKIGNDETAIATDIDVQPAALPFMFGTAAFCKLHEQLQQRGIHRDTIIELINRIIPKPLRSFLINKLTEEGVDKLATAARFGCNIIPRMRMSEEMDNEIAPASLVTDVVTKKHFCELLKFGDRMGVQKSAVSQFIRTKFPAWWRKHLLGQLFEEGLLRVVETAHKFCFAAGH